MKPRSQQVVRTLSTLVLLLFVLSCRSGTAPQAHTLKQGSAPAGTVAGFVTLNGTPLPGATVTLVVNGSPFTHVTDANGRFEFTSVPPGTYRITSEMDNIQTASYTVRVTDDATPLLAIPMKVASVSESITVTAAAPSVLTTTEVQTTVTNLNRSTYIVSGAPSYDNLYAGGEHYASIAENNFTQTAKDHLSTFSIDVDTASYSNVRRILSSGALPQADAVRIEEMVNYFTYSYPEPANGKSFSVTTEVAGAPWATDHRLMRIGIRAAKLAPWEMKPCNLVFLIDTSGSMEDANKLALLKKAFRLLVGQLRAQDRVALVAYAGSAGLVLPSTSGAAKDTILDAIEGLQSGGSTAGGEGIVLAYRVAKENFIDGGVNRVILATDGDFNVGVSSEAGLEQLIEEKRKDDIELSVIGVGTGNIQDSKMELLADKGNGNYSYVDNLLEARKVFVDQIGGTLVTVAKDVKLQIDFDPKQVASYRLIGYENRLLANKDFDDDTKDAGELGSGHTVTALYELVPARGASLGKLAQLRLRYKPPHGSTSDLISADVVDEGRSAWDASDDLKFASAVAEFALLLRDSPNKGTSSWTDALGLAKISRGVDLEGYRGEFVKLIETARDLSATNVARVSVKQ
jgi:Ca-activated chloride channel homolog